MDVKETTCLQASIFKPTCAPCLTLAFLKVKKTAKELYHSLVKDDEDCDDGEDNDDEEDSDDENYGEMESDSDDDDEDDDDDAEPNPDDSGEYSTLGRRPRFIYIGAKMPI